MSFRPPLLSCIRYREVLLLQGPPLMGVALSIGRVTPGKIPALLIFCAASYLLVAHVWTLNDWADAEPDSRDSVKSIRHFSSRNVSEAALLRLSLALGILSFVLFATLAPLTGHGALTPAIAACIALLGFLYSHSNVNAKGVPALSSLAHFAGGILHFLLGWALFATPGGGAFLIAAFFALVFTAGHAVQEIQDYDADRARGIRTNAVAFGKTTVFIAAQAGFALAYALLLWLCLRGLMPRGVAWLPPLLVPVHAACCLRAWRAGLSREAAARLRANYRAIFAIIGVALLILRFALVRA